MEKVLIKNRSKTANFLNKLNRLKNKAKDKLLDTRGDHNTGLAVGIIIAVVIGALVLVGISLLWESTIMPMLTTAIKNLFG